MLVLDPDQVFASRFQSVEGKIPDVRADLPFHIRAVVGREDGEDRFLEVLFLPPGHLDLEDQAVDVAQKKRKVHFQGGNERDDHDHRRDDRRRDHARKRAETRR